MISVIVPVYNAEKYIKQTVEAIQNQDYQELEILLINDGSKDNSLRICQEIARADDRVRVFDQANCGVSKARNRGLQEARGEYIAFADADDNLEKDMLSTLYDCMQQYHADIVSCGAGVVENGRIIKEEYGTNTLTEYDTDHALQYFLSGQKVNIGVWTKLFRRELLQDIQFMEDKKINEDKLFIFDALLKADKFVVKDVTKYYYCKREGSATTREFDQRWFDSLDITDMMEQKILKEKPQLKYYAQINRVKSYYWLLLKMYRTSGCIRSYPEQYQRIVSYLKKTPVWKMKQYLTSNMLLQIILLKVSEPLLRKMKQKGK